MKSSGYPHLDVFAFSALFRPLFFISMVSTSCHLQTMRANVNFPHVHFCARGAMHGSDPEGERVAQTEGVGRGTLGIYIRQCDWVVLIDLSFPSKTLEWSKEYSMRTAINCCTVPKDSTADEKKHRLLLSQQDTSRDYMEICSNHVSKAVLSLITLKWTQCL